MTGLSEPTTPPHPEPVLTLLVSRARIALWTIIAANVVFAPTDFRLAPGARNCVLLLKVLQIGIAVAGLRLVGRMPRRSGVTAVLLGCIAVVAMLTAVSGAVADDIMTTLILYIAVPLCAGTLVPWGAGAQFLLVLISACAILLDVWLTHGSLAAAWSFPAIGTGAALIISIGLASILERQYGVYFEAERRRIVAEAHLQEVNESLEHRVRERTRALELANARLDDARKAAEEAEYRFRTVATLTSDYAFSFRVEPGLRPVVEWLTEPSFQRVTGYSAAEAAALGGGMGLLHPQDGPIVATRLEALLAGQADVSEFRIIRKDGAVRWIREHGYPEWDETRTRVTRIFGAAEDITERRQLEQHSGALLEIARDISGTLEIDAILERVQRRMATLLPCDMVATFCWDAGAGGFRAIASHGLPAPLQAVLAEQCFPLGAPFDGRVAAGESLVLADMRELPGLGPALPRGGLIAVPLRVRGRYLGTLVAATVGDATFAAEQVGLCEGIAAQLSVALEAAELYAFQRDEAHISGALVRVGQELIASLGAHALLQRLCAVTVEVMQCDCSHTLLYVPQDKTCVVIAQHGYPSGPSTQMRSVSIPAEWFASLEGFFDRNASRQIVADDGPGVREQFDRFGIGSALAMPLRRGDEIVGLHVCCYRTDRRFTPVQERIGRGIAQLASFALDHARAMEAIEKASRLKSEFVATMSHELRTPLNIMIGYNDMLLAGGCGTLSADQISVIQRADASARELLHLIENTLDLGRLEAGRAALTCTLVDIKDLIAEVRAEVDRLPRKGSVAMAWTVPDDLPPLMTDRGKLKVVLKNLVTNAIKFTDRGRIEIRVSRLDSTLDIAVEDTGIGIPAGALDCIFEPFRQGDASPTRQHGGVGLGLYIVRRLLERLGGSVTVTSNVGVGTGFYIRMPVSHSAAIAAA